MVTDTILSSYFISITPGLRFFAKVTLFHLSNESDGEGGDCKRTSSIKMSLPTLGSRWAREWLCCPTLHASLTLYYSLFHFKTWASQSSRRLVLSHSDREDHEILRRDGDELCICTFLFIVCFNCSFCLNFGHIFELFRWQQVKEKQQLL